MSINCLKFHRFQSCQFLVLFLILFGLLSTQPALTCSLEEGKNRASLTQRVAVAPYVFQGIVKQINPPQAVIEVSKYFKGNGPVEVNMTGFNETTCNDYLTVGQEAIFFGKGDINTQLSALYDSSFGSIRRVSGETLAALTAIVDCMATYQEGSLLVPCIATTDSNTAYSAQLSIQSSQPMRFVVNQIESKKKPSTARVEELDIRILESFPVQVQLVVKGALSDSCEKLNPIETDRYGQIFTVTLTTHRLGEICLEAEVPFEKVIPLEVNGLQAGVYTVSVNELHDQFELQMDNIAPSSQSELAHVEEVDLQVLNSSPAQVNVIAKGYLSDSCEQLDQIETRRQGKTFTVTLTIRREGEICLEVLTPFEEVIPLEMNGLETGVYTVKVNNDISKTFEL